MLIGSRIAFLVERFPVRTESFIQNEIGFLRAHGVRVDVLACSRGKQDETPGPAEAEPALADVSREREAGGQLAPAVWRAFPTAVRAYGLHPPGLVRIARELSIAARLAPLIRRGGYASIHAHFINRPALVAALLSRMTGLPFSVAAHGRDVFAPDIRVTTVLGLANRVLTCSTAAHHQLLGCTPERLRSNVMLLHHGVDLTVFT